MEARVEGLVWTSLDLPLVQILVQVAIREVNKFKLFLSAEEANGFSRMANDAEWVEIKGKLKSVVGVALKLRPDPKMEGFKITLLRILANKRGDP